LFLFAAGGSFGAGYGGGYGGGAMKSSGYSQRAAGPYGGMQKTSSFLKLHILLSGIRIVQLFKVSIFTLEIS